MPCDSAMPASEAPAVSRAERGTRRGVLAGLFGRSAVFRITTKAVGGATPSRLSQVWRSVRGETLLLLGLIASTLLTLAAGTGWLGGLSGLGLNSPIGQGLDASVLSWAIVLGVQGLPYTAALVCAGLGLRR